MISFYGYQSIFIEYKVSTQIRFKDKKGEQHTLFLTDPSGNTLEFKAFKNDEMIFDN